MRVREMELWRLVLCRAVWSMVPPPVREEDGSGVCSEGKVMYSG